MIIPKSLHTVTAVRNVAMYLRFCFNWKISASDLVDEAFEVLGYGDRSCVDLHDLRTKCIDAVQSDINKEDGV